MDKEKLNSLDISKIDNPLWNDAIKYFEDRYFKRYFNQLEVLLNNDDDKIKFNCGFLVITIDCILLETLEQFYKGKNEIKEFSTSYFDFFKRNEKLKNIFEDYKDAGIFFGIVRSGLIHQAMTKKSSIINVKDKNLVIKWIDVNNKHLGFEINRTNFHTCILEEYNKYLLELKSGNKEILKNFKDKLNYILS